MISQLRILTCTPSSSPDNKAINKGVDMLMAVAFAIGIFNSALKYTKLAAPSNKDRASTQRCVICNRHSRDRVCGSVMRASNNSTSTDNRPRKKINWAAGNVRLTNFTSVSFMTNDTMPADMAITPRRLWCGITGCR